MPAPQIMDFIVEVIVVFFATDRGLYLGGDRGVPAPQIMEQSCMSSSLRQGRR